MYEARVVPGQEQNKINITDSEVVHGHRTVQTNEAKWLCLDQIYEKFHRPNFYDIGGTHMEDVADYWFTYKTEQVGDMFLLHLFVCNRGVSSFTVAVSGGNKLRIDKKNNIVYLQQFLKEYRFKKLAEMSHSYLTTYNFSELDVACLQSRNLYIAVALPHCKKESVSFDVISSIKINHDCGALLTDPIGSDFTIESADGSKFQIHKVILAAHSEVFKAMLKEETAESQNSYVKLVDVGDEDLRYMLEYIYTGTVKDIENINFENMLMLADRYNLKGLWELSQYALSEQLSLQNALDLLIIADMYDSEFLKMESMKFIKNNKEVLGSNTFKEINNVDLVRQLCTFLAS
ncbi:uncharacterized protein LOC142985282 [Anticarsia gemmatalis]|uniref:uncharacterized protein LOC142985282 n=1 Tax=Anticarsia gemmatalis TaxID=129554 RepID=UPI003F75E428